MIRKTNYQTPRITVEHIETANIIAGTGAAQGGPTADSMKDPTVSGVRANFSVFDDDEDEE